MHSAERGEFEEQLAILCAGFNVPVTAHRKHAYFTGLAKMSLAQFVRCVDHAVSDERIDELPSVKGIWRIHHELRGRQAQPIAVQYQQGQDPRDHLSYYANRLLLRHLTTRGGLGSTGTFVPGVGIVDAKASQELLDCRKAVHALVDWFTEPVREGDELATPQLFIGQFIRAIAAVSTITPEALSEWQKQCDDPAARIPFPPWMARPLDAVPTQLEALT